MRKGKDLTGSLRGEFPKEGEAPRKKRNSMRIYSRGGKPVEVAGGVQKASGKGELGIGKQIIPERETEKKCRSRGQKKKKLRSGERIVPGVYCQLGLCRSYEG